MIPAGIMTGLFPQNQMQTAAQPFVWGNGGRRMTPEDIAREREIAANLMQTDYSPVDSPWQGLARVAGNVTGALRERKANKASEQNADYSAQIAQSLINPSGTPSASAPLGAASSSTPGGNFPQLMQVMADPYADANVKAIAQMQLEQQQKMAMKQFEYSNREQPEIVQLATIANDTAQPAHVRKAAADRITAMNDPMAIIPGLPSGTYVGRQSGVAAALGGSTDAPDTLPPDFFDDDPPGLSAAPPPISAARAEAEMKKARAEGDAEMRRLMGGR